MLRILHLDYDENEIARLRAYMAERLKVEIDYVGAADGERFHTAIANGPYDLILGSSNLPDISATTLLQLARTHCPDAAFVLLSDNLSSTEVLNGVRLGADDVVGRRDLHRLLPIVRRAASHRGRH